MYALKQHYHLAVCSIHNLFFFLFLVVFSFSYFKKFIHMSSFQFHGEKQCVIVLFFADFFLKVFSMKLLFFFLKCCSLFTLNQSILYNHWYFNNLLQPLELILKPSQLLWFDTFYPLDSQIKNCNTICLCVLLANTRTARTVTARTVARKTREWLLWGVATALTQWSNTMDD